MRFCVRAFPKVCFKNNSKARKVFNKTNASLSDVCCEVVITKTSKLYCTVFLGVMSSANCQTMLSRYDSIFRPWLWLKFGWVGGKRFFLKRLSFSMGVHG